MNILKRTLMSIFVLVIGMFVYLLIDSYRELSKPGMIVLLYHDVVKKGAIGYENRRREYHYYPLVEESVLVKKESRSFLKRVFGGALKPMIATMVESEKLSKEEIEELKNLFENKME